jgi:hypothetical protein
VQIDVCGEIKLVFGGVGVGVGCSEAKASGVMSPFFCFLNPLGLVWELVAD